MKNGPLQPDMFQKAFFKSEELVLTPFELKNSFADLSTCRNPTQPLK